MLIFIPFTNSQGTKTLSFIFIIHNDNTMKSKYIKICTIFQGHGKCIDAFIEETQKVRNISLDLTRHKPKSLSSKIWTHNSELTKCGEKLEFVRQPHISEKISNCC